MASPLACSVRCLWAAFGEPSEIAETALFLASPAASFIQSVEISVDGGMTSV